MLSAALKILGIILPALRSWLQKRFDAQLLKRLEPLEHTPPLSEQEVAIRGLIVAETVRTLAAKNGGLTICCPPDPERKPEYEPVYCRWCRRQIAPLPITAKCPVEDCEATLRMYAITLPPNLRLTA